MSSPTVSRALNELERYGAKLTLEDDNIRICYRCPARAIPTIKAAIAFLKAHKQEAIGCLAQRAEVDASDTQNWPRASLKAEQRFGHPAARLYPFLGQQVRTPLGVGKLLQVFQDRATVLLDAQLGKPQREQRESYFGPVGHLPAAGHVIPNATERSVSIETALVWRNDFSVSKNFSFETSKEALDELRDAIGATSTMRAAQTKRTLPSLAYVTNDDETGRHQTP